MFSSRTSVPSGLKNIDKERAARKLIEWKKNKLPGLLAEKAEIAKRVADKGDHYNYVQQEHMWINICTGDKVGEISGELLLLIIHNKFPISDAFCKILGDKKELIFEYLRKLIDNTQNDEVFRLLKTIFADYNHPISKVFYSSRGFLPCSRFTGTLGEVKKYIEMKSSIPMQEVLKKKDDSQAAEVTLADENAPVAKSRLSR